MEPGLFAKRQGELADLWKGRFARSLLTGVSGLTDSGGAPVPPAETGVRSLEEFTQSQIRVDVSSLQQVSYALQMAGIGLVRGVTLKNNSHQPSPDFVLQISLQPDDYGQPWEISIPGLAPGQVWEQSNVTLPLNRDRLRSVLESEPAALKVTLRTRDAIIFSGQPQPVTVLAYNEWLMLPGFLEITAAFVQSNKPALQMVMRPAVDRLESTAGTRGFSGYQRQRRHFVVEMLEAIHHTLNKDIRLSYRNPPPSHERTGQKIRLVEQTLEDRTGTCFDLAVLQAALWEHVGLAPMIILVPGHALLACWLDEPPERRPSVVQFDRTGNGDVPALQKLLDALNAGSLLPVNSVEVANEGMSFADAVEHGGAILKRELEARSRIHFVDIAAARHRVKPLP